MVTFHLSAFCKATHASFHTHLWRLYVLVVCFSLRTSFHFIFERQSSERHHHICHLLFTLAINAFQTRSSEYVTLIIPNTATIFG